MTGQVVVSFTASSSLGTPAITSYTVKCLTSAASPQSCAATGTGVISTTVSTTASPLQATFTGLTTATVYSCYAISNNGVPPGDQCSAASNTVAVRGPPTAPTMGSPSSSGSGLLSVPFTISSNLGSPAITATSVKCINTAVTTASCGAPAGAGVYTQSIPIANTPTASFSGLPPGGPYVCYAGELFLVLERAAKSGRHTLRLLHAA